MQFLSDNAARVHPKVWAAMQAADEPAFPYDGDSLSQQLDARFSELFGRECAGLWVGTGTAANCLALSTMVDPHGGVICHHEAHIETSEGGAPGFYLHGAKLMLAGGEAAKLSASSVGQVLGAVHKDVHYVQPQAISISQVSEYGCAYAPEELAQLGALANKHGLALHMDGARFANAVAALGGNAAEALGPADALSFGFTKNGALDAEAIVLLDPAKVDLVRMRRKRAGHLKSKGRYVAAQILAMLEGDLWLDLARHANAAAAEIAAGAGERLAFPAQSNELFVRLTAAERDALRQQGFAFYDWDEELARFVTAWETREDHAAALATAIAAL